jgi:hypothetical protein
MQYEARISVILFIRADRPEIEEVLKPLPYLDEKARPKNRPESPSRTVRKVVAEVHHGAADDAIRDLEHHLLATKVADSAVFKSAEKWIIVRVHDPDFLQINLSPNIVEILSRHGLAIAIENRS